MFQRFVPVTESTLKVFKISSQKDEKKLVNVTENVLDVNELLEINDNDYVCCQYDDNFYIRLVKQSSDEHGDFSYNS